MKGAAGIARLSDSLLQAEQDNYVVNTQNFVFTGKGFTMLLADANLQITH